MRVRLDLAYDGQNFSGWAHQPNLRTVQGVLEHWITTIARLPEPARLTVAGRTDAGVHARNQVAHLDLPDDIDLDYLKRRLDRALPEDIALKSLSSCPDDFDARFAAIWRRYCYRIWDEESVPNPIRRFDVAPVKGVMNIDLLNQGGQILLGLHNFAAFCKYREGATTIRTLQVCEGIRLADSSRTVEITVQADAFCHSMVRSLVGALVSVATGQRDLDWLAGLLTSETRESDVFVMPAKGLTLEEVHYPDPGGYANRVLEARTMRSLEELQP